MAFMTSDSSKEDRGLVSNTLPPKSCCAKKDRRVAELEDELRWRVLDQEKPKQGQWCALVRSINDAMRCGVWDSKNGRFLFDYQGDPARYWKPISHIPNGFNGEVEMRETIDQAIAAQGGDADGL